MLSKWELGGGGGDDGRTMIVILYIGICVGAALAYVAAKEKELARRERALYDRELAALGIAPGAIVLPPPAAAEANSGRGLEELIRRELRRIVDVDQGGGPVIDSKSDATTSSNGKASR
jgi:hypothetical protein